jgi:hypothetical protein
MNDKNLPMTIPPSIRDLPVRGRNLAPGSLGDQLLDPTLVVFLRHLG